MNQGTEIKEKGLETKYYKHSSHATYNLTGHCVWITKYRRKVITEEMKERLETIIKGVCKENYVIVVGLGFEEDHVHLLLSFPITADIPHIFKLIKGRTSHVIRREFKEHLKGYYKGRWAKNLWAVGYFFCSVGKVDEDIVKRYVENQGEEECRGEEIII